MRRSAGEPAVPYSFLSEPSYSSRLSFGAQDSAQRWRVLQMEVAVPIAAPFVHARFLLYRRVGPRLLHNWIAGLTPPGLQQPILKRHLHRPVQPELHLNPRFAQARSHGLQIDLIPLTPYAEGIIVGHVE